MMNNYTNPMTAIMGLMSQAGGNPQQFANSLLQNNPQFAKALQGQNPQQLAMRELHKRGINPDMIVKMMNGRRF